MYYITCKPHVSSCSQHHHSDGLFYTKQIYCSLISKLGFQCQESSHFLTIIFNMEHLLNVWKSLSCDVRWKCRDCHHQTVSDLIYYFDVKLSVSLKLKRVINVS